MILRNLLHGKNRRIEIRIGNRCTEWKSDDWEKVRIIDTTTYENPAQITFISLQDLKGAKFAGGSYEKLEWVQAWSGTY